MAEMGTKWEEEVDYVQVRKPCSGLGQIFFVHPDLLKAQVEKGVKPHTVAKCGLRVFPDHELDRMRETVIEFNGQPAVIIPGNKKIFINPHFPS